MADAGFVINVEGNRLRATLISALQSSNKSDILKYIYLAVFFPDIYPCILPSQANAQYCYCFQKGTNNRRSYTKQYGLQHYFDNNKMEHPFRIVNNISTILAFNKVLRFL